MGHKEHSSLRVPSPGSIPSWVSKLPFHKSSTPGRGGDQPHPSHNEKRSTSHLTPRDCELRQYSEKPLAHPSSISQKVKSVQETQQRAYSEALATLTSEDRRRIHTDRFRHAGELLASLSKANEESYHKNGMRKGMDKLGPKLEVIQKTVDIAAIFGGLEPTGSVSVVCELISAGCSVGIELAEASGDLDREVHRVFDRVPRLLQCDRLALCTRNPDLIHKDLVSVYEGMFKFYLVAIKVLESQYVPRKIHKHKDEIAEIVEEFVGYWDQLIAGVEIDTLETATMTLDSCRKSQIDAILEKECAHEDAYEPPKPAAGTCQWLFSAKGFELWHKSPVPDTKLFTLFGPVGSGKTVATGYLAGFLSSEPEGRTVISYYIHGDNERSKPTNIYCSLIKKFLSKHSEFEVVFWALFKKYKGERRPEVLRACFVELLEVAQKRVCILLDAIDILNLEARKELHQLIQGLLKLHCHCKVFMTSQHDNHVKKMVPRGTFEINISREEARDETYLIAKHLMDQEFFEDVRRNQYNIKDQQRLIKGVSELADGSPMMVYLNKAHADTLTQEALTWPVDEILHIIGSAPSGYSSIPHKWAQIREQVRQHLGVWRKEVDLLLRFLAIASRPVTIREACTLAVYATKSGGAMPRELSAHEQEKILQWVRPFVATYDESSPDSILRLYHNSLQKLIILKEPDDWGTTNGIINGKNYDQRKAQMNGELASKCFQYLRFPECSKEGFIQSGCPKGGFFSYAACAWPHHLAHSATPTPYQLTQQLQDVTSICQPGSVLLRNWVDQNNRCGNPFLPDFSELDPLVVSVHLGLDTLAAKILDQPDVFNPRGFSKRSAEAALTCALQTERFTLAQAIFAKSGTRLCTLEVWRQLMSAYNPAPDFRRPKPVTDADVKLFPGKTDAAAKRAILESARAATLADLDERERRWQAFLAALIQQYFLPGLDTWAADALWEAVLCGCVSVVKQLFACADKSPGLRQKLRGISAGRDGLPRHQVVGMAALQGDVEMLRCLLTQHGIERHAEHLGSDGETVFHAAAQMTSSQFRPEVFVELKTLWPGGMAELDAKGRKFTDLLREGEYALLKDMVPGLDELVEG